MTRGSIRNGAIAGAGLAVLYAAVVAGASGSWGHLADQARRDWYYLILIVGGFGIQVALTSELRRRHRHHKGDAATTSAGAGASTVGMVACCAHHVADLAPFIGATGAAAFLTGYRIPFMLFGLTVNAIGITIAARRLRRIVDYDVELKRAAKACVAT